MKALAKAKFPLGCSYNPNKMIVYYNPMNARFSKYNYDASENKRAICIRDVCENNDDLAVSLFVDAADFNVNDCDSAFRFIEVNQLTCDNAIESLTLFGMINTEVDIDGKTFADICCQSCTQIQCTLDVDSSQMASGECTDGQESFEFCGKTQCITNPDCKYADFGLDDANDNFICPMDSFDESFRMLTSGKCSPASMINEIDNHSESGLCKSAADLLGARYEDFGAKKPSDMKALAKAKFPLGCSYNPNKMIVYYNPMNADFTKYNYDASENKRAICIRDHAPDSESAIAGLNYKKHKKNLTNIGLAQSVSANSLNLCIYILATIGALSMIFYGCKAINSHLLKSYEFTEIKDVEF